MHTYPAPSVSTQIDRIRDEIRRVGFCIVGCDELTLLCSEIGSAEIRFQGVKQIADWECWAMQELHDDRVRFSALPPRLCRHDDEDSQD